MNDAMSREAKSHEGSRSVEGSALAPQKRAHAEHASWKKDEELGTPLGMRAILTALRLSLIHI